MGLSPIGLECPISEVSPPPMGAGFTRRTFHPAPPSSRTAAFRRSGWKSRCSAIAFPVRPGPNPGPQRGLRPPTAMKVQPRNPSLCVLAASLFTAPAPRGPLLRRCVIAAILAPTAPCASLVPTSELPAWRLYRWPRGQETFPALHLRPCDRAAALTPESSYEDFRPTLPRPQEYCLRRLMTGSALSVPATAFPRGG